MGWEELIDTVDGKEIRSTEKMDIYEEPIPIVSAHISELKMTLAQETAAGKSNEIPAMQNLIKSLEFERYMVVADALNCRIDTVQAIIEKKADYLLSAKDNQPTLKSDIEDYIQTAALRANMDSAQTSEREHSRKEIRTAFTTDDVSWQPCYFIPPFLLKTRFSFTIAGMSQFRLPENLSGYHIHMIGIKGTGMAALAELLSARGARITGSDVADVFYTDALLKKINISVTSPFSASNIPAQTRLAVYSPAYTPEENAELHAAFQKGIPVLSYPEALGAFSERSYSVGIAGVHGKTTTTAIIGTLLQELNLEAAVLAGSAVSNFNNSCTMIKGAKYFVAETCEYKRHFLLFHPKKIVLTSVESDHQDYYPRYEDILTAFLQYLDRLPHFSEVFYCADDPGARETVQLAFGSRPDLIFIPYGKTAVGDYAIKIHGVKDGQSVFSLRGFAGEFHIGIPGEHTVLNAAAAIALAVSLIKEERKELTVGDLTAIRNGLASFKGAKRRSEIIGEVNGILFMDDYGHHPTAIKKTLKGLRAFYPKRRIVADFMSHTYSRTAALLNEFADAFSDADMVVLHKIYASAREKYTGTLDGKTLYEKTKKKHKKVRYFEEVMDACDFLKNELHEGDLFITIGAGDNWKLGQKVYTELLEKAVTI